MDRQTLQKLSENYVQSMPRAPQFFREGGLNPDWNPWMNSFDTWMNQAQTPVEIAENLYAVRTGSVVTVTGIVKAGAVVEGLAPAVTFVHEGVEFNSDGTITGGSEDKSLSVTFISRR